MSDYTVSGRFRSREGWSEFETAVSGDNEDVAREHAYSTLGSRHGLKRTRIEIEGVEPA